MPLMRLGQFVFGIPTFSFETLNRTVSARVESVPVVGGPPPTHLLGENADTLQLTCSFYPYHLNGKGLLQLRVMQQMTKSQIPMMMVGINGLVYGRWIITQIGESQSFFHPRSGTPQKIDADISMTQYNGAGGVGSFFGLF